MTWCSPGTTDALADGKWTTAWKDDVQALLNLMDDTLSLGSLTPSSCTPVVYSPTRHHRNTPPWDFNVTAIVFNSTPHWRKSRMTSP